MRRGGQERKCLVWGGALERQRGSPAVSPTSARYSERQSSRLRSPARLRLEGNALPQQLALDLVALGGIGPRIRGSEQPPVGEGAGSVAHTGSEARAQASR